MAERHNKSDQMDEDIRKLIQAIHDTPTQAVIAAAGAGTTGLAHLLLIGGASRTLLEAIVPYSTASFDDFLEGRGPKQYVSSFAARRLAGRALARAQFLTAAPLSETAELVGLGCTASLATDHVKRGEHRAHIAVWQAGGLVVQTLILTKGVRTRAAEEQLYSRLLLNALADASGVRLGLALDLDLQRDEEVITKRYDYLSMAHSLRQKKIDFFALYDHGEIRTQPAMDGQEVHPQTLLSGSFNPLHDGHLGMADSAAKWLKRPVAFELSTANVDKPSLPATVVVNRIAQFAGAHPIYVSNAPTYLEKARLYPGATFIVGTDTAERLFQPKYYEDSTTLMQNALEEIMAQGCRFLVAGREDSDGVFRTISDIAIPPEFDELFEQIPESVFRMNISSTQLRQQAQRCS